MVIIRRDREPNQVSKVFLFFYFFVFQPERMDFTDTFHSFVLRVIDCLTLTPIC